MARKTGERDAEGEEMEVDPPVQNKRKSTSSAAAAAAAASARQRPRISNDSEEGGGAGGQMDDDDDDAQRRRRAEDEEEDEEEDDEEDDMEDEEEDEEVARRLGDYVQGKRYKAINKPGAPPETGVIQKIYCENFMCHRKLSINFNRNVNFINGQNGSGKSAILVALQICLGARAHVTHRGNRLGDLIRQGHDGHAIVRVSLLNRGTDAFQHDRYGDYITVERRIEKNGGGGYRLLSGDPNHQDKLEMKSKSREDLNSMLDRFNIQVENPCALLDQENAKKFIQGDAAEKYKFFKKATDLARIEESLRSGKTKVMESRDHLEQEQERLPGLKKEYLNLQKKLDSMESLSKIEQEIKRLKVDLVWAHHEANKEQTAGLLRDYKKAAKIVEKLKEQIQQIEEQKVAKEAGLSDIQNISKDIREKMEDARNTMQNVRKQIASKSGPSKKIEDSIKKLTDEIKGYLGKKKAVERTLKEEREKMAEQNKEEVGELVERLDEIQVQLNQMEKRKEELDAEFRRLRQEKEDRSRDGVETKRRIEGIDADIRRCQTERDQLDPRNAVSIFGKTMEWVDKEIKKRKDWRQMPVGPLGLHVKIKDGYQEWGGVIENAIGQQMESFLVTCHPDRVKLGEILSKGNVRGIMTYTVEADGERINPKRAPQGVLQVTECINVENPLVWNALIDQSRIDQSAVFHSIGDAEQILVRNQYGVIDFPKPIKTAYATDDYQLQMNRGARTIRPSFDSKTGRRLGMDTSQISAHLEERIQELSRDRADLKKEYDSNDSAGRRINDRVRKLRGEMATIMNEETGLRNEARELEGRIEDSRADEDAGLQLSDLVNEIESYAQQIQRAQQQQQDLRKEKEKFDEELAPLRAEETNEKKRNETLKKELDHASEKVEAVLQEIQDLDTKRQKAERALVKQEAAHEKAKAEHASSVADDEKDLAEATAYTRTAFADFNEEWDGEPIQPSLSSDALQVQIKKKEGQLKENRAQHNTTDDINTTKEKCLRAKEAYYRLKSLITNMVTQNEKLVTGIDNRRKRARSYRRLIVRQATRGFDDVLQHKGQSGDLVFDHKEHTLNLTVQKDNRDATTQSKNVKELSGGERSFTTLALLLALGESVECPFRVMDEFDIFMDAVSRKIALELLLQTATSKAMEHRQFIFITPQDLSSVTPGGKIKIHKLRPPERNNDGLQQTTL